MKKIIFFVFLFVIIAASSAIFWGYQKIEGLLHEPIAVSQENNLLIIKPGTTGKKLGKYLQQQKIIKDSLFFPYLLKMYPKLAKVKAGSYSISNIHDVKQLLELLVSGKEAQFSLQFIDGEPYKYWLNKLSHAPHLKHTLKGKSETEIFKLLGMTLNNGQTKANLEGWLYPDTYNYVPGSTDLALLKRANLRMKKALMKAWDGRAKTVNLKTPYQMLILASIVEKESGLQGERGKVAQVFLNRLRKHMRLQTDPTVIYGMGSHYNGNITKKDLQTYTPYNTYFIKALPPTPITMPSVASLQAVAHPETGNMLYFVADGSGGHKFSRTLVEHNQAVKQYLRFLRNNKNEK